MIKQLFKNKKILIPFLILFIILTGSAGYLIYMISLFDGVENIIRYIIMLIIIIIWLLISFFLIKNLTKKKKKTLIIILLLLSSCLFVFIAYNINKASGALDKVTASDDYTVYSSSIVTTKNNKAKTIDDIGNSSIAISDDTDSIDGYQIPKEIIKKNNLKNNLKNYKSYITMIDDLLDGTIDFAFLPSNYATMLASTEGYENLADKTKKIYTQKKKVKKSDSSSTATITNPFTLLLMGVDSDEEGIENGSLNGDSLMLITFNPETLNTTVLSIPRDTYVPITCFTNQRKNKITHAAWQGESCMQKTIENFLDINIDYYVKINFKGVVKLVNTLGGVKINVPYNLCEQNSSRQWGSNTIYIEQGIQTLNGEQALAYARNRHPNPTMCSSKWTNYTSNDFIRGQHQQEIVESLLSKIKSIKSLNTVYNLLDTISNNMATNMSRKQILSLYSVGKKVVANMDKTDSFELQKLYINGYDQRIYDYGGTNLSLYNYVPYDKSVTAVSNAMKVNLGLKKATKVKKMNFDINTAYEEKVIGKDITSTKTVTLLPSFIGKTTSYASSYASSHGFNVSVKGGSGTIISQNISAGANVKDITTLTVTSRSTTTSTVKTNTSTTSSPTVSNTTVEKKLTCSTSDITNCVDNGGTLSEDGKSCNCS